MAPRKLKFRVDMIACPPCGGFHAHWWFTSRVNPPSCAERQKGKK